MPGRQSTGAASRVKPKVKGRKKSRSLNALAIAEKQIPSGAKFPLSRADEFEGRVIKRQRESEDGDPEPGREVRKKKRREGHGGRYENDIESGSDSDGNKWILGGVNSNQDSELDSDEAFGESDEEKFEGFTLRGSSTGQPRTKPLPDSRRAPSDEDGSEKIDLREDGDSMEASEQSDGLGDDAVDLAAMLDDADDSHVDYRKQIESDGDSTLTNSDMEDDQPNSTQLESLQKLVSNMDSENKDTLLQSNRLANVQESMTPSQFGINSTRKLTVSDLIPSITDSKLKKSLKLLVSSDAKGFKTNSGIPKKLDVPLAKRQQDRLNRAAAYDKSKETLNRWIDTVKYNRRAEHIAFPLKDPNAAAASGAQNLLPLIHSQPVTELEGVIQNILQDSGLAPTGRGSVEDQDEAISGLQRNKISLQDVQARRAELRRARELLFREEVRSRRIKKIKSKSYRRVHRKEREKAAQQEKTALAAAGVDNSESEQDRMDRRRAEERVGARHRESKWAKKVKESGRAAWDEDARSGLLDAARRGEELTRRVQGKNCYMDESGLSSSDSDSDGCTTDGIEDQTQANLKQLGHRIERLEKRDEMLDSSKVESKSGLFSMKFMQKADALRKERNDADLDLLRREAAGEDTLSEEEAEFGEGRRHFGPRTLQSISTSTFGKEDRGGLEEEDGSVSGDESRTNSSDENQQTIEGFLPVKGIQHTRTKARTAQESQRKKPQRDNDALSGVNENPWLSSIKGSQKDGLRIGDPQANAIISPDLTADGPVSQVIERKKQQAPKISHRTGKSKKSSGDHEARILDEDFDSESDDEERSSMPPVMRDQELIRKAFAGDKVVADFEKEKQNITRDEEEQVVDSALPGWGNWTGAGISKKEQKRQKGRFLSKVDGIQKEKRKDAKLDRVIINEKRVLKASLLQAFCGSSAYSCRTSNTLHRPYHTLLKIDNNTRGPFDYPWGQSGQPKRHFSQPLSPGS